MSRREAKVILIVGRRQTGKTTLASEIVRKYQGRKVLIYDASDQKAWRNYPRINPAHLCAWKSGVKRIFEPDTSEAIGRISECVSNALIVFDDASKYISHPNVVRSMLVDCRHRATDLLFIFHSLAIIHPDFFRFTDGILLFKTNDTEENLSKLDKIPEKDIIINGLKRVRSSENPHDYLYLKLK